MRVGLEHIDLKIASAMRARLCANGAMFLKDNIRWSNVEEASLIRLFLNQAMQRPEQRPPEEAERLAYTLHRQREKMAYQRGWITLAASLIGGGLMGMLFYSLTANNLWIGATIGTMLGAVGLVTGSLWTWHATSGHELYYEVTVSELQAVVPLLTLTDLEAAYCDLLTRVCDHDPNQEARRAVRRHLTKMKEAIEAGRQLEAMAENAARNEQTALQERIDSVVEERVDAVDAIADALCTILVLPSPAGDRASELIDKELQTCRKAVETLAAEAAAMLPADRKRRREKVS